MWEHQVADSNEIWSDVDDDDEMDGEGDDDYIYGSYILWMIMWSSCFEVDVVMYAFRVPAEEKHEATEKRNKEAATTEFQLWEGYLQKVLSPVS